MPHSRKTTRLFIGTCKILLAATIISYLLYRIHANAGFSRLFTEEKQWGYLALAQGAVLVAFTCSFVRWYMLVRGLDLQFHLRDAFRLGSLGFMLNQILPGSVGGDLFKAVFVAHEQPGRRAEAIATVIIDRVVGLAAMLILASLGLLFARRAIDSTPTIRSIQVFIWTITGVGTALAVVLLSPWATGRRVQRFGERIPLAGNAVCRIVDGLNVYKNRRRYLVASFGLALVTHCLLITAFWCTSQGLPVRGPTVLQTASIVPLGFVAGAIPLTPGGLGLLESGMAELFTLVGSTASDGALVALAYRAMTYVMAMLGACYYVSARKKVDRLLEEAEALAEEEN